MFGGLTVYAQVNWPKVEDGTRTVRLMAHPLILWLARWLRLPEWVTYQEATFPKYRDADPIIDERCGALFCSFAQADYLKREVAMKALGR